MYILVAESALHQLNVVAEHLKRLWAQDRTMQ